MSYTLFPFKPLTPVLESLEWRTDVLEAHAGAEQRIRLRTVPRQEFEFEILLETAAERSRAGLILSGGHGGLFGVPVWHEQQSLPGGLAGSATAIPCIPSTADYRAGGYAVVWAAHDSAEVVEIDAVGASSLTLAAPIVGTYSAGSLVMPMRLARLHSTYDRADSPGDGPTIYRLRLACTDNVDLAGAATATQYLTYDVLTDPYLLPGEAVQRQIERPIDAVDPGLGAWAQYARTDYPLVSTEQRWRYFTAATAWTFRGWLHRRAGRCNPVWIPTWRNDLQLAATIGAADTSITVEDVGYRTYGFSVPTRQDIAIMLTDGTIYLRRITAAVAGAAGEEVLSFATALGAEIPTTAVKRISFLSLHRFAADRIELAWERVGVCEIRAAMVGVAQ
jgi:hypothetical protein